VKQYKSRLVMSKVVSEREEVVWTKCLLALKGVCGKYLEKQKEVFVACIVFHQTTVSRHMSYVCTCGLRARFYPPPVPPECPVSHSGRRRFASATPPPHTVPLTVAVQAR
jgi:hypothetical protein